jgi:hypothetical protein
MSPKQKKIAAKAPPPDKIDAKDFAVLKAEKAKGRGMGLQDESVQPGKVMKAKRGKFLRSDPTKPISSVQPSTTLPKDFLGKRKALGGVRASLGMLKGPAKAGAILGAALTVPVGKMLKKIQDKRKAKNRDEAKVKKMGGGMMQRPMGYKKGKMFDGYLSTFDASAEASTPKSQRGVTTIVGVKPGAEIGKGKKRFTKQKNRAGRPSSSLSKSFSKTIGVFPPVKGSLPSDLGKSFSKTIGVFPQISSGKSDDFVKRRMELAVPKDIAKKALKATRIGKIALGIGAAGVAASQYLKSKMKKDEPKKKMVGGMAKKYSVGGGMMQRPMGGPMGGMMQRPMGYKDGTKPGAGPLGAAGLRQPAKENIDQIIKDQKFPPISIYIEDKKKPQKPFPVPSLYNNNKKADKRIRQGEPRAKKKPSNIFGYKSGTMVKARGCKLGRTRPTKMY